MQEQWKPVKNYEDYYEVSNLGNVKSLPRLRKAKRKGTSPVKERILKSHVNQNGYTYVCLRKDGKSKTISIHKLVAEAFIGPTPTGMDVDHIDENKANNNLENLQYITHRENIAKSMYNRTKKSTCVYSNGKRWSLRVQLGGRMFFGGVYDTEEEAKMAYKLSVNNDDLLSILKPLEMRNLIKLLVKVEMNKTKIIF